MSDCKIYTLHDPQTMAVRYVGKTSKTLEDRLAGHLKDKSKCHRTNWIKSLPEKPIIRIVETVDESEWQERETFWIKHFRDSLGCDLVNGNDGGVGGHNPTKETREKIGLKTKARMALESARSLLSRANSERMCTAEARALASQFFKNLAASEQSRRRMSENTKRRWESGEMLAIHKKTWIGRKHSQEAKEKIGAASRGRVQSRAVVESRISKIRGKTQSEAHVEARAASTRVPIIELETGRKFQSVTAAAKACGLSQPTVSYWLKKGAKWRYEEIAQ